MADFTETFRLRLDLGDIGGAAATVEREVARIRSLVAQAQAPAPGTSAIPAAAARAEAVAAVPVVQQRAQELAAAAPSAAAGAAGAAPLIGKIQAEVAALSAAVAALGTLPPAVSDAARVAARVQAAADAARADAGVGRLGGGTGPVPDAITEAAVERSKQAAALEAADRTALVATVRKRLEAEQQVALIEAEVEAAARVEIAQRTQQVPVGISTGAIAKNTQLAELEAADRTALVATVRSRITAEEKIRAIETEVEAQARAEIAAASGARVSTVPTGISSATASRVEELAGLEAASRQELVAVVRQRIAAEQEIRVIQGGIEAQARTEIAAQTQQVPVGVSAAATAKTAELAELEAADREALVAAVQSRIGAEEKIRAIQTEVEAQARAGLAAQTGVRAATLPAGISAATTSRVEQLAALEAADRGELVASVRQRIAAEQQINTIERQVERQARAELAAQGSGAGGAQERASLIQRIQAFVGGNQRPAEDYKSLSQVLTSRLLTSSTFAVTGFAAYSAVTTIKGMVEEAQRAQLVFGQLKAEFDSIGQGDQFPKFRDEILAMSRELGIGADKAAAVGISMKGAFGDSSEAIAATHEALVAMTVGGFSEEDARNLGVAIPKAFDLGTAEIRGMNDELLHLQDVFGVTEKEIASGVGNIAPLARELGLSFKETSVIIAAATAASGRSATQVASEIGRAVTQIEKNAPQILQIFDTPKTQTQLPAIQSAFATGDTGQVLVQVFRAWKDLNEAQKNAFITMVGGRREAASLAAALGQSSRIVRELDDNSSHAGRSAASLAEFQKTLAAAVREAQEAFKQLGQELLRAGLGTVFSDIVKLGGAVLGILGSLIGVFASLNEATGGALAKFVEFALALAALNRISQITFVTELLAKLPALIAYLIELPALIRSVGVAQAASNVAGIASGGFGALLGLGGAAGAARAARPPVTTTSTGLAEQLAPYGITAAELEGGSALGAGASTVAPAAGLLAGVSAGSLLVGGAVFAALTTELQRENANTKKKIAEVTAQYAKLTDEQIEKAIKTEGNKPVADPGYLQTALPSTSGSLWDQIKSNLNPFPHEDPGVKKRKDVLEQVQRSRLVENEQDQIKALLDANFLKPEDYDAIQADLQKPGDKGAFKDLQSRIKRLSATPQGKKAVEDARDAKTIADQQSKIFGDLGLTAQSGVETLDDLKQSYAQGDISATQYVGALQKQLGELQPIIDKGGASAVVLKQGAQLRAAISAAVDDQAKRQAEISDALAQYSGQDPSTAKLQSAVTHFNDPRISNDPAGREAAFKDILSAQQAQFNYILSQADTVDKINKIIREGVQIDPGVRAALLRQQTVDPTTGSPEWQQIAADTAGALHASGVSIEDIINTAVSGNESVKAAAKQVIQQQIADIDRLLPNIKNPAARQDLLTQEAALQKLLSETQAPGTPDAGTPGAQALTQAQKLQQAQAENAITAAQEQLQKSKSAGDPVGQANLDLAEAKKELAELDAVGVDHATSVYAQAQQKVTDAANNLRQATLRMRQLDSQLRQSQTDDPVTQAGEALSQAYDDLASAQGPEEVKQAQIAINDGKRSLRNAQASQVEAFANYRKALDEGDPVQVALDGVAAAQAAVVAAGDNKTAWAAAQAQLVQAQREVNKAQVDMFTAQTDVNKAVAQAAGDSVGVAEIELQQAQFQLAAAAARGDRTGVLQAQAAAITAQAGVVSAQVQTSERNIDFALEMRQITVGNAIKQLTALLSLVQGNTEETQQILLKIKQLQSQGDIQFDLPSVFGLPTLYEARRLAQSGGPGGYQNNSQVSISYYAYNQTDHEQNVNDIAAVVAGPAATGTYTKRY